LGISINYKYLFDGGKEELVELLQAIRLEILELDLIEVSEVIEIDSLKAGECQGEASDLAMFLAFSLHTHPRLKSLSGENDLRLDENIFERVNGAGFFVLVSEGCEPFVVALGRIEDSTDWFGSGFTKTMGAEDFEKAHQVVVDMLRICQKHGILEAVIDEAGIWQKTQ